MILLTDEEIQCQEGRCMLPSTEYDRQIAKAQLRNVVEWGNEDCPHNPAIPNSRVFRHALKKRQCEECWQALLKEIEKGEG